MKILKLKSTIVKIKNLCELLNSRFKLVKETSEIEDNLVEIMQYEEQRKMMRKNEHRLREMWDSTKLTNMQVAGMPRGEERDKG